MRSRTPRSTTPADSTLAATTYPRQQIISHSLNPILLTVKNDAETTVPVEKLIHLLKLLHRVSEETEVASDVSVDAALLVLLCTGRLV